MNILIAAHAPWRGTGYGTPVMLMAREWHKLGHEVAAFAIEERGPGLMWYGDIEHSIRVALPNLDPFGMDAIKDVSSMFGADVIVSLFDPWVLSDDGYSVSGLPWYAWFPVDQDKAPYHLTEQAKNMARPVVYSQYAADRIKGAAVIEPPIDVVTFHPADRAESKRMIGLGGVEKLVGLVGSNIRGDRKALEIQVRAFAEFVKDKPEVKMILVTEPAGNVNLIDLISELQMRNSIYFIDPFSKRYQMSDSKILAQVYNSFDVLLHASAAEGFGMCIAEAMACGVPVIYADNTSQPEVSGGLGYAVTDMRAKANPHGGKWQFPTIGGVVQALESWYANGAQFDQKALRSQAEKFNPAIIAAKWQEVFDGD